ncbi:S46 family peptidase [Planktosalinus lacus]|uniref:Dipeptidyl-peptidase n=1 Tax=Planktosalinus lacus TaxID=1526573 RepID=A0A8J2V9G1_9FLAO|nr:S46 family peptidase [Planktosalinus lacus]GGD87289.1 peptidase S46 [Planktosalinus lacus]
MKKLLILVLLGLFIVPVKANEGMWFLMHIERLNYVDMQKMGLQLTPEEIYSVNNNSLKDAIVQFGGGCTAEIISSSGLILTNHHCGYGKIAELSTEENDYLTNGFWAKSYQEELKPKDLSVRFFVRMDDVTSRILNLVNDEMTEEEREKVVNQEIAKIQQENNEGGKYTVSVKSFYSGNEYYYFVYEDYDDVRFVGAPPSSIGKFGGDTDNWEWPRHTGDFALFRVYGDEEGKPARYSEKNVPVQVDYHLPVSLKGIKEDDFAMILGYPGRTNRWMPAAGIDQNVNYAYPAFVEASKVAMDAMKVHMDKNQQVKLDYASRYAGIANYWKNRQGMIDALKKHKTASVKREQESKFIKEVRSSYQKNTDLRTTGDESSKKSSSASSITALDTEDMVKYSSVMDVINEYYEKTNKRSSEINYIVGVLRSSQLAIMPIRVENAFAEYFSLDEVSSGKLLVKFQTVIDEYYETYNADLEKDVFIETVNLYALNVPNPIPYLDSLKGDYKRGNNSIKESLSNLIDESIFSTKESLEEFLKSPDSTVFVNDPIYKISKDLLKDYRYQSEEEKELEADYQKAYRLMIQGMREMNPDKKHYPDANSTLRLSYGKVRALPKGKKPNDAKVNYYTTLKGTVAKYQPGDDEFDMPKKLIDLYNAKDFGPYADQAGHMPVNFLTDHDITGGNSGSPVLNGKGELIGLAFDGNIEAMAGDVIFDDQLQRAINVDVRYILFIIDKYAGAKHLVDEMTIVK